MGVWFAILASTAFTLLISPQCEFNTIIRIIFAVIYSCALVGGMFYESTQKDKIQKLENEVEKLKEKMRR